MMNSIGGYFSLELQRNKSFLYRAIQGINMQMSIIM